MVYVSCFCSEPRASGTHGRSMIFPSGNQGYRFVQQGSRLATRCSLLLWYSLVNLCRFLLEQPQGSKAPIFPRLQDLFSQQEVHHTGIWGGAYASDPSLATPKRHWLYSNDPALLSRLEAAAGHLSKSQLDALGGEPLTKRQKGADGKVHWSGNKEAMSKSQSFG